MGMIKVRVVKSELEPRGFHVIDNQHTEMFVEEDELGLLDDALDKMRSLTVAYFRVRMLDESVIKGKMEDIKIGRERKIVRKMIHQYNSVVREIKDYQDKLKCTKTEHGEITGHIDELSNQLAGFRVEIEAANANLKVPVEYGFNDLVCDVAYSKYD
jgi:chromosome segregation ATPase